MTSPSQQRSALEPSPPSTNRIGTHARALAAVAAIGLAAYWNAFGAGFTYDDFPSIVQNHAIQDLGRFLSNGWRQRANREIAYLTFALNYRLGGLSPFGYHAVNVAIHLVNAALVYALVTLSFRTPGLRASTLARSACAIAFVAAGLFVAHPIQTEAVTYVVQRLASLATTFYLATVVLYLRWRIGPESGGRRGVREGATYAAALASAVLAMHTKQTAFTLPLAVCLAEGLFFEGERGRRWLPLLPLLATMSFIPLRIVGGVDRPLAEMLSQVELPRVQTTMSRADYLATQAHAVFLYLRLIAVPVGQNVDHDHPQYHSFLRVEVLAPAMLIAGLIALAAYLIRRARGGTLDPSALLPAFGILWFFLGLSVESTLVPIVDLMVEHRVYLPSAGAFITIAVAGAGISRRLVSRHPDRVLVATGTLLAVVLAGASFSRNTVWASELTLWADAAEKSPAKARPLNNLGAALNDAGRFAEAMTVLERAIRTNPGHADGYYNLGRNYLAQGASDASIPLFRKAIALNPEHASAYANLAAALLRLRRFDEVVSLLEGARDIVRDAPEAQFNLGVAYVAVGNSLAAQRQYGLLRDTSPELALTLERFALESRTRAPR